MRKNSFDYFLNEVNREIGNVAEDLEMHEAFSLTDEMDHEIIMHRDVHFSGSFDLMLKYYKKEKRGIEDDFSIERIEELADQERAMGQNIAAFILSGTEAEKIAIAKRSYQKLRGIYDVKKPQTKCPRLVADLILSESQNPKKEIEAIVKMSAEIVPFLIKILRTENLYDRLFPGSGMAPFFAAECLGKIGDEGAIVPLFETLGRGDFFAENKILDALKAIGGAAKEFLLNVLQNRPINQDNERAAMALAIFECDKNQIAIFKKMLQEEDVLKDRTLTQYLEVLC